VQARRGVLHPSTYDWQSLGHDASHDAYENDPNMSVTIAPTLGINWMTNLLSPDVGGPTIAFNPTLNATVIYSGDQRGNVSAINEATGLPLWTTSLTVGAAIYSTPMISSDETSVWVGTTVSPALYKLNAATGKVECSVAQTLPIQASPTEGTSSNGTTLVYISTFAGVGQPGPLVLAYNESTCALSFSSSSTASSVASAAYGVDKNGRQLVFQGTTAPGTEYAIDATTGAQDWDYVASQTDDIAAASTVSAPGNNGFADGVVYSIDRNQICYANDLTTGALLWQFNFGADAGLPSATARSSAALDGNTLVLGMGNGVYALNATTGAKLWHFTDTAHQEVISNPAVVGPPGQEVVAFGDLSGEFYVIRLSSGGLLYHYQTHSYITGSPSYVNGHFLITSTDGFLYDFAANGGNASAPKTSITSPSQGAKLSYAASVSIQGVATDAVGVNSVQVAVQDGGPSGPWYDLATNSWSNGALTNSIAVASPGSPTSNWTFTLPTPKSGTTLHVFANAVNVSNQADVTGAQVSFGVGGAKPKIEVKTSSVYLAPGATFKATGSGFAPSETVTFSVSGVTLGTATAKKGKVSATLTLPTTSSFGAVPFTGTGDTSKKVATTPIYIANSWAMFGGGPTHPGFEPNDPLFAQLNSPGGNTFLTEAWYYAAGAPVESSPAVYQGATIFGDDAGTITSVATDTATAIWSYTIPSKAAIRSAPAIDASTGDLAFAADDGNVYVLNATTGTTVCSASIGGLLSSPVVGAGHVFVGSNNDSVTSVEEGPTGTCKIIWSQKLKGTVATTPTLDSSERTIIVGDSTDKVSAFLSNTGLLLWQYATGGPIVEPPTVVDGIVYAASGDEHLYAINEEFGTRVWVYSAGTTITTGAAYDPILNLLYLGLTNGRIDAVNIGNGTLAWSTVVPKPYTASAYVGMSAVSGVVFGTNSGAPDGNLTAFSSTASGAFDFDFLTGAALTTSAAINDGTVYLGASDGGVYALTPYGALPLRIPQSIRVAARAADAEQQPAAMPHVAFAAQAYRHFSWAGQRDVPLHIDSMRARTAATAFRYHGGPTQTAPKSYAIFWTPPAAALDPSYERAVTTFLKTSSAGTRSAGFGGAYLDSAQYPAQLSDGAFQTEIAKAIAANHWSVGINSQFFVLTAPGALAPNPGFCSYHSAFTLAHNRLAPVVYGVVPYSGAAGACAVSSTFVRTGDAAVDAATANLGRLQSELVHDPLLNGWYDSNGNEVGPTF
jgi:outer membrane protein assembly factor BamB